MSDWRSIETAPKDGTVVDLWVRRESVGYRKPGMYAFRGVWLPEMRTYGYLHDDETPTHWIPAPDPPEAA